ncbi:MAG: carboxypeptidase-like regulatory domain-containing protein [Myxococcota bacterium]
MQLLGRRVGILVAAWLLAACPRYSRQPPPYTAQSSETAGASFASNGNRASARAVPLEAGKGPTCISGIIKTSGAAEIPVARARVKVARGETVVGETTTDDQGRFTWCAPRALDGMTVRTSVHVEKAAFVSSERELEIPVGTTTELTIGLNPTP